MKRWLPIGLLAFTLALIGCTNSNAPKGDAGKKEGRVPQESSTDAKKPKDEKASDGKPDFALTSEDLAKEFIKDEKAADAKYKDKVIEVTGDVTEVSKPNAFGIVSVNLKGAKSMPADSVEFDTRALFPQNTEAKDIHISAGQKVKAVGKYANFTSFKPGGYLNIVECTFTELKPGKAPAK